jgi:hypothetical protein
MTPPPAAAAAPAVRPRRTGRSASRAPAPRRVSGPGSRKATGSKASAKTVPRVAGRGAKTAPRVAARGGAIALPAPGGMALGLIDAFANISRHRWLDRLIRGRVWIALVAFALIGIVAMQLWVVKLGVGIGRALEHEGLLQRENAALSIEDAQLSSGERVEQLAAARGMVVAAPGSLRFDASRGALDARLAAAALAKTGQITASGPSSNTGSSTTTDTGTAASGTEAASSTEAAAQSSGTATAVGSTTSTGAAESATAASTPATASTPEGTSDGEASATATPVEGAATNDATGAPAAGAPAAGAPATGEAATGEAAAGAPAAGGGAAAGESAAAGAAAVGSDGGTQQPTPGG